MKNGVTLIDPATTYIEADVKIGADTVIEPGVSLKGKTVIGEDCVIGAHSELRDTVLEDGIKVKSFLPEGAIMRNGSNIGPYSHLRPQADIGEGVHIGNFVEVKKATLGKNTKSWAFDLCWRCDSWKKRSTWAVARCLSTTMVKINIMLM